MTTEEKVFLKFNTGRTSVYVRASAIITIAAHGAVTKIGTSDGQWVHVVESLDEVFAAYTDALAAIQ